MTSLDIEVALFFFLVLIRDWIFLFLFSKDFIFFASNDPFDQTERQAGRYVSNRQRNLCRGKKQSVGGREAGAEEDAAAEVRSRRGNVSGSQQSTGFQNRLIRI